MALRRIVGFGSPAPPALALALALACGAPPPVSPAAPAAPPPPPTAASCVFHTEHWNDREPPRLALRPGARAFAEIYGDSKDVTLVVDDAGARLEIASGPVKLRGFVGDAGVDLYPSRAFELAGFAVPDRGSSLEWKWSAPGRLSVSMRAPRDVLAATSLTAVRPCADLSLEPGSFDALDALGGPGLGRAAKLRAGHTVKLAPASSAARAAPLATVKLDAERDEPVVVVAEEGGAAHVAWRAGFLLLHGWVPASELASGAEPIRPSMFISMNADHFNWPRPLRMVACPRELALFAAQGAEPAQVGTVTGGAVVGILDEGSPFTAVRVMQSGVLSLDGAALSVRASELSACKPSP